MLFSFNGLSCLSLTTNTLFMNIIITGSSKGFGKAIAEKFSLPNDTLYLCARSESTLKQAVDELRKNFPNTQYKYKCADLSIPKEAIAWGEWVLSQTNHIDILVNNAGRFIPGAIHNESENVLIDMMQTNVYSAYHLTRTILPSMMETKAGHIFNICSIAALQAYPNGGSYSISKHALLGFSKNLREELKPYNIKVTAVCPGAAYTDSWAASGVKRERIMEANDIAEMIYAASKLSPQAVVEDIIMRPQLGDL